ncbi:MAG: hypothetical protein KatS3mg108_2565 [Isosphaeraceae bacterium]|jgi:hypothetical protein|nr:MAG: hypothetical protein KatS3mg108_2565 [Isosphaeraceae bacterium]
MAETPTVTVQVVGGPSARVRWSGGMTALNAMEMAQAAIEPVPDEQFTFGLQYYGAALGYLVSMINETYDSFISRGGESASPFFYWQFLVNGVPAAQSVDRTMVSEGDVISFEFQTFVAERHKGTLLAAKHAYQTR